MRFKTSVMTVAGVGMLALLLAWWGGGEVERGPRATGTGAEWKPQAYVWQRAWGESVRAAVREEGPAFGRVVALARQIEWQERGGSVIRVGVDWESLRASGTAVGAGIRINPYHGPFDGAAAERVCDAVRDVAAEAERAGVALAEIQLDFDAATSQLPAYRGWLQRARAVTHVPITFTALPTWMESSAFPALARDAGYFVLQVHWLAPPKRLANPLVLCDIPTARRAMERAGRIGVPFRLALPTYGYLAAFHPDGSFAAIAAEDAPHDWAAGLPRRTVEANSAELAAFVDQLAHDRPLPLAGIVWYRLPIETDRWNWSWPTLRAVMQGCPPQPAAFSVEFVDSGGVQDILLKNTGEQDAPLRDVTVRISWNAAEKIAADGFDGFAPDAISNSTLLFHPPSETFARLKPGTSIHVGWVRLSSKAELHAQVERNSPHASDDRGSRGAQ